MWQSEGRKCEGYMTPDIFVERESNFFGCKISKNLVVEKKSRNFAADIDNRKVTLSCDRQEVTKMQ